MPNSSRRKQSKPQHLPSEEEEGGARNEMNQTVTSSCPADGVKNTQEDIYGSKVTGLILRENGDSNTENIKVVLEKDHDTSKTNGGDLLRMTKLSDKDSLPHDLSVKTKVTENNKDLDLEDQSSEEGLVLLYSPPSLQLGDKQSPADFERPLRKHTGETPFHSDESLKQFKSKHSLHYHQRMSHSKEPSEGNTTLRYQYFQKSQKEESFSPSPNITQTDTGHALNLESGTLQQDPPAKRQRLDNALPLQTLYNSAIVPGSADSGYDLRVPKTTEPGPKGLLDENESQDFTRACPVCTKVFPKPSDLKRHMMCHTGEKPFRCEFCNKPFRAKSSMHYHLKAAHGVGIELSPGLEERYLRNKARSQMNMVQRNQFTDASLYRRDNQIDIDDIDEDSESVDSSHFPNSGIGSEITDTKSQGHFVNTGNEAKSALDLSISGRSKEEPVRCRAGQLSENIIRTESLFKKSKISIQNETILVTRLDGLDMVNGQSTSIYKCYLCGKMFHQLSKLQCHLSLHFEKHLVTYECCFCEDVFQFKVQLRNHVQRRHSAQLNKSSSKDDQGNSTSNVQSVTRNQCDNQYTCRYCQKVFTKQISFNKHMRLHFWNRNCFCRICGKSFIHYTSLQLHMSRFHWKTIGKSSKSSPLRRKINFFNTYRFKPESYDGIPDSNEPLDLIKAKPHTEGRPVNGSMTLMLPKSPLVNGDHSDTGMSLHSSENNWSSNMSSDMYETEDGVEIMSAPKRSLIPFKGDQSPRHKFMRKSTPNHLKNQTQLTSDNSVPLNFIKSEPSHQDSNNNESVQNKTHPAPESKGLSTGPESLMSGYSMNATNHLLMAKALAAHQTLSHLTNTSQPMIFPPNHLPPSLAAMTQMMTLPVSVPALNSEAVISTSQSPSPASHTSSKSDTSPDDRDNTKETGVHDPMAGYPRVQWSHFMYSPSSDTGHTDGRKVSSLSRTHSRLGIVHTPINREAVCKPTVLADGRTVYKCPFCTKEFVSFSDINRHMDFHEGKKDIRPYKCQYCDYYARTNSQLKVHMMRHQGIREYCCKLCNYKGVTQSDLNRHMKSQIHMLKARNACSYCGEGFVTMKNLEKHLDGNCIVKMQKLNGGLDLPLQESIA